MLATLRVCALGRIPSQPWKPSSPFMPGLALSPDPLLARLGPPVTVGDREANQKLDSFSVASEDLGLEEARSRHTICQRTDKEVRGDTLTIEPSFGGRRHQ